MTRAVPHPLIPESYARPGPRKRWQGLGLTPDPLIRVFGLRRSGNHAVIDWLLRNAPGEASVFLNCCAAQADPFETAQHSVMRRGGAEVASVTGPVAMILSYEDTLPQPGQAVTAGIVDRKFDHEVLIYRGFLNWAASLTAKLADNPRFTPWSRMQHLIEACRQYDRVLKLVQAGGEGAVLPICYDAWFDDEAYRRALLARLGWEPRDPGLGAVQPFGGGSSFGETGAAETLGVHARWRRMADNETFGMLMRMAAQHAPFLARLDAAFPDDAARLTPLAAPDFGKDITWFN